MQKIKKILFGEQGTTRALVKMGFLAAPAKGWAEPKIFWVVPRASLGVCKSTPKVWVPTVSGG